MRILIIGGGYSGACFAIQALIRSGYSLMPGYVTPGSATKTPAFDRDLQITIVEPREELGQGVAYSTKDPDHRINAPSWGHMVLANDVNHFHQWFLENGGLQRDPQADEGGLLFPRRIEFGRYLGFLLARPLAEGVVQHCQDRAVSIQCEDDSISVKTAQGKVHEADRIVIATGHLPARAPDFVSADAVSNPQFRSSPWEPGALANVAADARVLILGSGLSAADAIATLRRGGHRGMIRVVSRRGLRPQSLPPPGGTPPLPIWQRLQEPIPEFLRQGGGPARLRALLRALRLRIAQRAFEGVSWHEAFDDLRDSLYRIWPELSAADQRQFHRHLRPWYDAYRYRMPPQTGALVAGAEASGRLVFEAARVLALSRAKTEPNFFAKLRTRGTGWIREELFDVIVNCTGPGPWTDRIDPFIDALLTSGLARLHGSGVGLDVDQHLAIINPQGQSDSRVCVIGPPSAGASGDSIGAVFICAQIDRMLASVPQLARRGLEQTGLNGIVS